MPVSPGAKVMAWVAPGVPAGAPASSAAAIAARNEPEPESLRLVTTNWACADGANAMHPPIMAALASSADRILRLTRGCRRTDLIVATLAPKLLPPAAAATKINCLSKLARLQVASNGEAKRAAPPLAVSKKRVKPPLAVVTMALPAVLVLKKVTKLLLLLLLLMVVSMP